MFGLKMNDVEVYVINDAEGEDNQDFQIIISQMNVLPCLVPECQRIALWPEQIDLFIEWLKDAKRSIITSKREAGEPKNMD